MTSDDDDLRVGKISGAGDVAAMVMRLAAKAPLVPDPEAYVAPEPKPGDAFRAAKSRRSESIREIAQGEAPHRSAWAIHRLRNTDAVRATKRWCAGYEWCLLLSGPPGVGKTVAAAYAAMREGGILRWLTASKLMRVPQYDQAAWSELEWADLVVLDDLGTEFQDKSGAMQLRVDSLIDDRYSRESRLVITTNLNTAEFKSRYGERVADRIRDGGSIVGLDGKSLRGRRK